MMRIDDDDDDVERTDDQILNTTANRIELKSGIVVDNKSNAMVPRHCLNGHQKSVFAVSECKGNFHSSITALQLMESTPLDSRFRGINSHRKLH
jgi:hypothetical protein